MKLATLLLVALCCCAGTASAYTQADRDDADAFIKGMGFPPLAAFSRMTPKMVKTIFNAYTTVTNGDAFEYLSARDLEIIYTAVSAQNNCEICLSFHAMALGNPDANPLHPDDLAAMLSGGVPTRDKRAHDLAVAAKYALAHKGILLPREKQHLATMGFDSEEKMLEIIYAAGFMAANNAARRSSAEHLIGNESAAFAQLRPGCSLSPRVILQNFDRTTST